MLIESIIKRTKGTTVNLDGADYAFKPNAAGAHVCEVTDKGHVARLLAIPEGYAAYQSGNEQGPAAPVAPPVPPAPDMPAVQEAGGEPQAPTKPADTNGDGVVDKAEEVVALRAEYEAIVGAKAHGRWGIERLKAEIDDAKASKDATGE